MNRLHVEPIWEDFVGCPCCEPPPPVFGRVNSGSWMRAMYLSEREAQSRFTLTTRRISPATTILGVAIGEPLPLAQWVGLRAVTFARKIEAETCGFELTDRHPDWQLVANIGRLLTREEASADPLLAEFRIIAELAWLADSRVRGRI